MAQQLIDIGTVADDRTGDDLRVGGGKINDNFTELFDFKNANAFAFIAQESNFDVQDATTITLESQIIYVVSAGFTTAKRFVCENGAVLTSFNLFGPVITYSGVGSMFTGVDINFTITDMEVSCPAAQAFSFTDTVGGSKLFICRNTTVRECTKFATLDDMMTVEFVNTAGFDCTDGISLIGSNWSVIGCDRFALLSSSATFKGIDLGTAIVNNIELDNLVFVAPAGAFGISGAAASANVPAGLLAMVSNSAFFGGMTALETITNEDIRWVFTDNTPIPDTIVDGMLSISGNAAATVIASANTPVLMAGTWIVERTSLFTGSTAGRLTYNGERDIVLPIDATVTVNASSGTNKDIHVYFAVNGTVITGSGKPNRVGATDPRNTGIIWQLNFTTGDYVEVFLENNTDTVNLVGSDAVERVR